MLVKQQSAGMRGTVTEAHVCGKESTMGHGSRKRGFQCSVCHLYAWTTGLTMTRGNKALPRPAKDGDVASEDICTPGKGMGQVSTISIN